jgi:hypothetical protein
MVEFALVAPVLLAVLLSIMGLGLLWGKHLDLQSATRDGVRKASISITAEDPQAEAEAAICAAVSLHDCEDIEATITPDPPWNHGDLIRIQTSAPASLGVMNLSVWTGTVNADAEARVE